MKKYKKLVTHPGVFHADEVVACAVAIRSGAIDRENIERRPATQEDLDDPDVMVVDQGGQYDHMKGNFDHHQDPTLPASNILGLNHLMAGIAPFLAQAEMFWRVSAIDTGSIPGGGGPGTLNRIINSLNGVENGFNKAIDIALTLLDAEINAWNARVVGHPSDALTAAMTYAAEGAELTTRRAMEGQMRWGTIPRLLLGKIAVDESTEYIPSWKALAEKDGVMVMVSPSQRGGFQVVSRDSEELTIAEEAKDGRIFRHASGFMASYNTLDEAVAAAVWSVLKGRQITVSSITIGTVVCEHVETVSCDSGSVIVTAALSEAGPIERNMLGVKFSFGITLISEIQ